MSWGVPQTGGVWPVSLSLDTGREAGHGGDAISSNFLYFLLFKSSWLGERGLWPRFRLSLPDDEPLNFAIFGRQIPWRYWGRLGASAGKTNLSVFPAPWSRGRAPSSHRPSSDHLQPSSPM